MPEVVQHFPGVVPQKRSKYEQFCDGQVWKFTLEDLAAFGLNTFDVLRNRLYHRARHIRGRRIRVCIKSDCLYCQAFNVANIVVTEKGPQKPRIAGVG